jgi:hypothetical protein
MMMAESVYILCSLTSLFCAAMLVRTYRVQRTRLLLWSSLSFVGLAVTNALLVIDLMVVPEVDLLAIRITVGAISMLLLLIGLIWEVR